MDLKGKKAVIFGVATDKSIAWSIAKALNDNGCQVALGYQERVETYVKELAKELDNPILEKCDMMDDLLIERFFETIEKEFGKFDILVHSVAFAKRDFLQGKFYEVDRKGYNTAQEVSAFSLPMLVRAGQHLMNEGASVMAMTYLGSVMALQNYNVMGVCKAALESSMRYLAMDLGERGIRVNAISAGPIPTLAASGVGGFDKILDHAEKKSLLKRNISTSDVAHMALFLASPLSKNITGQVLYVDAGYSVNGW
ncbi:enoyl-ACP reductase [Candidatus Woesearchaeota archaeon]|nr:enoyl-ACP reductase [Candidatus Woesearchaeota archaeon]